MYYEEPKNYNIDPSIVEIKKNPFFTMIPIAPLSKFFAVSTVKKLNRNILKFMRLRKFKNLQNISSF